MLACVVRYRAASAHLSATAAFATQAKPADPMRWLADWLEKNNPNTPQVQEPLEA
jgi:hypothetical protein